MRIAKLVVFIICAFSFLFAEAKKKTSSEITSVLISTKYKQAMKFSLNDFYKASFKDSKGRAQIQSALSDADFKKASELLNERENAIFKECARGNVGTKDCEIKYKDPFAMIEELKKVRAIYEKNIENTSLQKDSDKHFLWVGYTAATKAQIKVFETWMADWTQRCMHGKDQNSEKCLLEDKEVQNFMTDSEYILSQLTKEVVGAQSKQSQSKEMDEKYEKYSQ